MYIHYVGGEREREQERIDLHCKVLKEKIRAISYKIYLNSILKNLSSLFHPIKSVFF